MHASYGPVAASAVPLIACTPPTAADRTQRTERRQSETFFRFPPPISPPPSSAALPPNQRISVYSFSDNDLHLKQHRHRQLPGQLTQPALRDQTVWKSMCEKIQTESLSSMSKLPGLVQNHQSSGHSCCDVCIKIITLSVDTNR